MWLLLDQKYCRFHFPQPYQAATTMTDDGYPLYRRRDLPDRRVFKNGRWFTNADVVPYNPWLLKRLRTHLNVQVRH